MVLTEKHLRRIYFTMCLIGVANIIFSLCCAVFMDCNQYSVCYKTLHGTMGSISYPVEGEEYDTIPIFITEDEYIESMCSFGLRFQNEVFNHMPNELIQSDRAVKVIGDHLIERYDDDLSRADAARRLVQYCIDYCHDETLYGVADYWARPTETLYHLKGDCEDVSILFCSICRYMGIDTVILDSPAHMAAAVKVDGCDGFYLEYNGERYYTCDLTGFSSIGQKNARDMIVLSDESSYLYYLYSLHVSNAYRLLSGIERLY